MKSKKNILLIPAWYPASFFQEQMEMLADSFNFKILKGQRNEYGKKKWLKKKLKRNTNFFKAKITDNYFEIEYDYINHLPQYLHRKQEKYLNRCFEKIVYEIYEGGKPDLVHIQSLSDTAYFICKWAKNNNIPVIITEHILLARYEYDLFKAYREQVYTMADKVLVVSNYLKDNLLANGIKVQGAEIVGNLIRDEYVSYPIMRNTDKNSIKIVFVAAHLYDKDIDVLFDTVEILLNKGFRNFTIDIIGLKPNTIYPYYRGKSFDLTAIIDKRELSEHIFLLGKKERIETLQSYEKYHFLVSASSSETFGLSVAEAIAYGLPVVCTDSGGIRDFVNETNGIIVSVRNAELLAEGIIEMSKSLAKYDSDVISKNICDKYGRNPFSEALQKQYLKFIK